MTMEPQSELVTKQNTISSNIDTTDDGRFQPLGFLYHQNILWIRHNVHILSGAPLWARLFQVTARRVLRRSIAQTIIPKGLQRTADHCSKASDF